MTLSSSALAGAACGLAALSLTLASAGPAKASGVDEYGHGGFFLDTYVAGVMAPDPGPGGLGAALTYAFLPRAFQLSMTPGDVILLDSQGGISDVVRFNVGDVAPGYGGALLFYSDAADGAQAPADTGLPTAFYANLVVLREIGDANFTHAWYFPTAGQPGYIDGIHIGYDLVSEGHVPEPAAWSLMLGGLGLLGAALRRRAAPLPGG